MKGILPALCSDRFPPARRGGKRAPLLVAPACHEERRTCPDVRRASPRLFRTGPVFHVLCRPVPTQQTGALPLSSTDFGVQIGPVPDVSGLHVGPRLSHSAIALTLLRHWNKTRAAENSASRPRLCSPKCARPTSNNNPVFRFDVAPWSLARHLRDSKKCQARMRHPRRRES